MGETLILGGGITGLTAAYVLHEHGRPVRLFEAAPYLGGASRTARWREFRFDLGGHRLYTRHQRVVAMVERLIGNDLLRVPRTSRIYLRGHFVNYPLTFFNALKALGPATSAAVTVSYAGQKLANLVRRRPDVTFEDWVVSRFGRRLYEIYFKTYSEKVWGVPCERLASEFAAQRIRGLSFSEAVRNMLLRGGKTPETLATTFTYPRLGFGQIAEKIAESVPADRIHLSAPVVRVEHDGGNVRAVVTQQDGAERSWQADQVITTIAVTDLVNMLDPPAPTHVREAARGLNFRDMIIVFLALDRPKVTDDHWIYFPDPDIFLGRVHEPKNWSAAMAPAAQTGIVAEVFCFAHEPVWCEPDESLMRRCAQQLEALGLIRMSQLMGGVVVRLPKAYPLYERGCQERLATVLGYLKGLSNLQSAGRNALFRYTSSDRYMEMAIKAAENVLGLADHDVNAVGSEQEYAEQ